jgi:hypothetical protein
MGHDFERSIAALPGYAVILRPPRSFTPPWSIEETAACFVIKDRGGQTLAYVYFEEEPGRVSGIACCGGGLASALTGECVGAVVLSSNARAKTHARLTRNARVRADPTRILSTNDTSLRTPLKRKHLFQVVDHDHPSLGRIRSKARRSLAPVDKAHALRLSPPFVSFSVGLFSRFGFEYSLHRTTR